MKRFSATYLTTLKNALVSSFWYKDEFRSFLKSSLSKPTMLDRYHWKVQKKREIADDLIDRLASDQATYLEDIECLSRGILEMTRYPGLERLEDGAKKIEAARRDREAHRTSVDEHVKDKDSKKNPKNQHLPHGESDPYQKEKLKKTKPDQYFGRVLGLSGKITKDQIRERYRKLIKSYHPDKFHHLDAEFVQLATLRTQEINEAYQYFVAKYGLEP